MMFVCLVCNGMESFSYTCPACHTEMRDGGKVVDFYGDYSPYIEIEDGKMIDGDPVSSDEHRCIHFGVCPACSYVQEVSLEEDTI